MTSSSVGENFRGLEVSSQFLILECLLLWEKSLYAMGTRMQIIKV